MLSQSCTMEAEPASQVVTRSGGHTTRANLASAPALPQQLWKTQDWVVPVGWTHYSKHKNRFSHTPTELSTLVIGSYIVRHVDLPAAIR